LDTPAWRELEDPKVPESEPRPPPNIDPEDCRPVKSELELQLAPDWPPDNCKPPNNPDMEVDGCVSPDGPRSPPNNELAVGIDPVPLPCCGFPANKLVLNPKPGPEDDAGLLAEWPDDCVAAAGLKREPVDWGADSAPKREPEVEAIPTPNSEPEDASAVAPPKSEFELAAAIPPLKSEPVVVDLSLKENPELCEPPVGVALLPM